MSDDLDDIKAMMDAATPRPDASRRAENLALAQKNFNDLQGSRAPSRPSPINRPKGLWTGALNMLNTFTSKAALTTTTALVACGFLFLTPQGQDLLRPPSAPQTTIGELDGPSPAVERERILGSDLATGVAIPAPADDTPGTFAEPMLDEQLAPIPGEGLLIGPSEAQSDQAPFATAETASEEDIAATEPAAPLEEATANESITFSGNAQLGFDEGSGGEDAQFHWNSDIDVDMRATLDDELSELVTDETLSIGNQELLRGDTSIELELPQAFVGDTAATDRTRTLAQNQLTATGELSMDPATISIAPVVSQESMPLAPPPALEMQDRAEGFLGGAVAQTSVNRPTRADIPLAPAPNTEAFPTEAPNDLKITSEEPVSTFSIDVDTAAYSVVRSSLTGGQLPPPQAVRIEELINYFPYDYPAPDAGEAPFRPTVSTFQTPWNEDTRLVHIALQGQMPAVEDRPPLNLVFLIDTSGSMDDPAKLPLLKQSFRLMLDQLRPEDEVAIVEYAGSAGQVLAPTAASERTTILNAIQSLGAGGSTNGQGGLQQAYSVAETMNADGEVNRIILATDGDFNVGLSNPDALKDFIADKRETGTYLSVLGFGRGNLDDATMQALAQNGNGAAAYIDTLSEAQKVLVDQLSGALFPLAGDVKVQVEFNPAEVAEYRLIGYETRALAREDFNNDRVDAGELGAGHSVTAIYEVTPVGSPAQLSDPLRYAPNTVAASSDELGYVKLRYKDPGEDVSQLLETPIIGQSIPGTEASFAAAIAGFGQLLRDDSYLGDWGYDDAIALANANRGEDPFGYRTEAVQLMRLAQSLSR